MIFDRTSCTIVNGDRTALFTPQQGAVLGVILAAHPAPALYDDIIEQVWGTAELPAEPVRHIQQVVCHIRKKLLSADIRGLIHGRSGIGFCATRRVDILAPKSATTVPVTVDLLEDIALLLSSHPDYWPAKRLIERFPAMGAVPLAIAEWNLITAKANAGARYVDIADAVERPLGTVKTAMTALRHAGRVERRYAGWDVTGV